MTASTLDLRDGPPRPLHPLRTLLLAGSVPLFLGVFLSDWAYGSSDQVQWKNFASWLNAGALVLSGLALLWAVIGLARGERRHRASLIAGGLLLVGWILGFVNSLQHAKDAYATMPAALVLSVIVLVLVAAACWFALDAQRGRRVGTATAHDRHDRAATATAHHGAEVRA